jgi:hypothetical protein
MFVARPLLSTLAVVLVAASASDANAFAVLDRVFDEQGDLDVTETLMTTGRWSVDEFGGLHDGVIDVAIQPDLAERLGVTDPGQKAAVAQAVVDGVLLWSSPALSFDVTMAPPDGTHEIEISAAPDAEVHALGGGQGGVALVWADWSQDRVLSNGFAIPGWSIQSVDIVFNATTLAQLFEFGLPIEVAVKPLLRLTTHEVGHGLGFAHPTDSPHWNLDNDSDPLNRIPVDPADPFAGLRVSTNVDDTAMMVPASDIPTLGVAFQTRLSPDDRAVRNVLYAVLPNLPPVCEDAFASPSLLWPPNGRMVSILIEGVTDPNGDALETRATLVTHDEPEARGSSSGAESDAQLEPLAVRAQRNGSPQTPSGRRVYRISFAAEDGRGGSCDGVVTVCVPHDVSDRGCADSPRDAAD